MLTTAKDLKEGDWFQFEYDWPWHFVFAIKDGVGGNRNHGTLGKRLIQTQLYGQNGASIPQDGKAFNLWIAVPQDRGVRVSEITPPIELTKE